MLGEPLVKVGQGDFLVASADGWPKPENQISLVTLCVRLVARAWRRFNLRRL